MSWVALVIVLATVLLVLSFIVVLVAKNSKVPVCTTCIWYHRGNDIPGLGTRDECARPDPLVGRPIMMFCAVERTTVWPLNYLADLGCGRSGRFHERPGDSATYSNREFKFGGDDDGDPRS